MKRCAGLFKLEEICKLWIQLSLEKDMFGRWYLEFRLQSDVYQTLFMTNLDRVTFAYSCVIRELNSTWEPVFNTQHCGRCDQANLVCGRREVLINKFVKGQRWYYMCCRKDASLINAYFLPAQTFSYLQLRASALLLLIWFWQQRSVQHRPGICGMIHQYCLVALRPWSKVQSWSSLGMSPDNKKCEN